ncbi:MAG: chorismate synthase, partial [Candidatus Omnitrophota bacterium]
MRYLTAGESHGRGLLAVLEGIPAGLKIKVNRINQEMKRRQQGYGRGKRMQIERDRVEILSGLKNNLTLGSPIGVVVKNRDF